MENVAVVKKTPKSSIFLGCSTLAMETPLITRRLKAADPTIVEGPRSPAGWPSSLIASRVDRMISGADEPKAISVKLANVAFQTVSSCAISLVLFVYLSCT